MSGLSSTFTIGARRAQGARADGRDYRRRPRGRGGHGNVDSCSLIILPRAWSIWLLTANLPQDGIGEVKKLSSNVGADRFRFFSWKIQVG